jgi:hypothetical protein
VRALCDRLQEAELKKGKAARPGKSAKIHWRVGQTPGPTKIVTDF